MKSRLAYRCGWMGMLIVLTAGCQTRYETHLAENERLRPHAAPDRSLRVDYSTTYVFHTHMSTEEVFREARKNLGDEFGWDWEESLSAFDPFYSRLVFESAVGAHVVIQAERVRVGDAEPVTLVTVNTGLWPHQADEVVEHLREATGGGFWFPGEQDGDGGQVSRSAE